jgi:hypothetical protein
MESMLGWVTSSSLNIALAIIECSIAIVVIKESHAWASSPFKHLERNKSNSGSAEHMKRPKYRVTTTHKASFDYALIAVEGDKVSIGDEDPEMPGWFWCKNMIGVEMWVPETHLNIDGKIGIFNQDYNSVELNAAIGDAVQFLDESLGWVECLDGRWHYGWLPKSKLAHT